MYDFRCRRHLPEVRAVSVVDSRQPVFGKIERFTDPVAFEIGNSDDLPALRQDAGHYQTAIMPAHLLIQRTAGRLPLFQKNNVMQRQHKRYRTLDRRRIARAMQQVGTHARHSTGQRYLLP